MTAVSPEANRSQRNGTIELMRFVFTLGVCLHHFYTTIFPEGHFPFYNGYFAVEFFFLIGGFFLAAGALKADPAQPLWQSSLQLLKKRFVKLLVPFYTGHLITFIITAISIGETGPFDLVSNYFSDISLLTLVKQAGFDYFCGYGHTWYISAMFLGFLVIVPLLLHYRENFVYLVAPVVSVFLYGFMNHEYGQGISNLSLWTGFFLKGQLRAFADICLGVFLYGVVASFQKIRFTTFGRMLLTAVEAGFYLFLMYYMFSDGTVITRRDYVMLFFLVVAVMLSLSGVTCSGPLLAGNRVVSWLGRFSLYLYLIHYIFAVTVMPWLMERIPGLPVPALVYLALIVGSGLLLRLLCGLISGKLLPLLKKWLVLPSES